MSQEIGISFCHCGRVITLKKLASDGWCGHCAGPVASGIEALVCRDIAARQQMGIAKYGKTVAESSDDMLRHAYEEALDLAVYIRAEMERRGR